MTKAVIIASGEIKDYTLHKNLIKDSDFIICADGGLRHAIEMNITPDCVLGDFDSYKGELPDTYIEQYPVKKDMTDTHIAVKMAIDKGFDEILIIGAIGSRIDHTLSNMQLLKLILDSGKSGAIINENNEIRIMDKFIAIDGEIGDKLSLINISESVEGITTKGLYYPLKDSTLSLGETRGVSNIFIDKRAEISIKKGLLFVIKSRD